MISGIMLVLTVLFETQDELAVKIILSCACAVESIVTINMIAHILGAW